MNKPACDLSIEQKEAPGRAADTSSDLRLVQCARKGDDAAFSKLVERYQRKVFSIALGMIKNREDAMDVTQDAFVKVHRYLGSFQGNASFYTWLYRITVNLCIDHIRKQGRWANSEFDEKNRYSTSSSVDADVFSRRMGGSPSKVLGRKELAERIQEAVDALPEYHKAVIIMREIDGLSYAEMAEIMKVSKGTIMSRLHHARQKLKKSLEPYLDGELLVQE